MGDGPGFFAGAHIGCENMLMADGLEVFGLGHVEVFATEPVPESLAPDRSPDLACLLGVERHELGHGCEAALVEALLGAGADTGQVAEGEATEGFRKDVEGKSDEAVGLFHVAGDFGEVAIGSEADGAAQHFAGGFADASFDFAAELDGGEEGAFAAHESAGHFVDGADGGNGKTAFDSINNFVMVLDIELVAGFD